MHQHNEIKIIHQHLTNANSIKWLLVFVNYEINITWTFALIEIDVFTVPSLFTDINRNYIINMYFLLLFPSYARILETSEWTLHARTEISVHTEKLNTFLIWSFQQISFKNPSFNRWIWKVLLLIIETWNRRYRTARCRIRCAWQTAMRCWGR